MIDHTKIKAGYEVQIANGDWYTFDSFVNYHGRKFANVVKDGLEKCVGVSLITDHRSKFNWDDVKSGDCFIDNNGIKLFFVGFHPFSKGNVILILSDCKQLSCTRYQIELTRHPEGDIKGE